MAPAPPPKGGTGGVAVPPSATTVPLPPSFSTDTAGITAAMTATVAATPTPDPESLLDALSASPANVRYNAAIRQPGVSPSSSENIDSGANSQQPLQQQHQRDFDPIDFLNQHYHTEQQLLNALPALRSAITARLASLDDHLSTTLRHQASVAPQLAQDVVHVRNATLQLARFIENIRNKAHQSEVAVLEITRDMKRLDYAKRHLQRTITALKRLHML